MLPFLKLFFFSKPATLLKTILLKGGVPHEPSHNIKRTETVSPKF